MRETQEVRREEDGELVGLLLPHAADEWVPTTVFGAALGPASDQVTATSLVRERGLSSLAERWWVRTAGADDWRPAWLLEVKATRLRLRWNDPMLMDTGHGEWLSVSDIDIRLREP